MGIILLLFGFDAFRILILPTLLLLFLSPIPLIFLESYGSYLIDSVATFTTLVLRLFLPVEVSYRPVVVLSVYTNTGQRISFELAAACSGFYSLIALGFFLAVILFMMSGSIMKKSAFTVLGVFVDYVLNALRIVLTVVLGYFSGYGLAVDFFHSFGGIVLLFLEAFILICVGEKLFKMSLFHKEVLSNCQHPLKSNNICVECGRVFKLPKTPVRWKHLAAIVLVLAITAGLMFQASSMNYNRVVNEQSQGIELNLYTGQTRIFSNVSGWSSTFVGREYEAERRLGLDFVGDYVLYREKPSYEVSVILELSNAQSKFHTWEGCLNYQSFDVNIERRYFGVVFDENDNIVTGETIIADAPIYQNKIIILYWFDYLYFETNETARTWAVKLSLVKYVYYGNDQNLTSDVDAACDELLAIGKSLERSWGSQKPHQASFVVDIYRNKEFVTIFVFGMIASSASILKAKSLLLKKQLDEKISELPEEKRTLLAHFKSIGSSTDERTDRIMLDKGDLVKNIESLLSEGLLKARLVIRKGELYSKWSTSLQTKIPKRSPQRGSGTREY
jgi:exosortase